MKTAAVALLFVCSFLFPEAWFLIPAIHYAVKQAVAWLDQAPVLIFGAMVLVMAIDTWMLQRRAKWGAK